MVKNHNMVKAAISILLPKLTEKNPHHRVSEVVEYLLARKYCDNRGEALDFVHKYYPNGI